MECDADVGSQCVSVRVYHRKKNQTVATPLNPLGTSMTTFHVMRNMALQDRTETLEGYAYQGTAGRSLLVKLREQELEALNKVRRPAERNSRIRRLHELDLYIAVWDELHRKPIGPPQ
jgi:hypothetical protein